jgi:pilus assembly protein CpaB
VLEKILVLAVAQEVARDETKPKVVDAVTLEVTPDQAEKIDLARSIGTLSLVLRNQVDPQAAATAGATRTTLLDVAVPAPASAPAPAPRVVRKVAAREPMNCVRVIVGGDATKECF